MIILNAMIKNFALGIALIISIINYLNKRHLFNLYVRNKYGNSTGYTIEENLAVTSNWTSYEYYYVPAGSSDDISFGVAGWHTDASKSAEWFEIDNVYVLSLIHI